MGTGSLTLEIAGAFAEQVAGHALNEVPEHDDPVFAPEFPAFDPAPFLRVPYLPHGSDEAGWDCAGLVQCLSARFHGVKLPEWGSLYAGTGRRDAAEIGGAVAAQESRFRRGPPGLAFPILVFRRFKMPIHLGLVCSDGWFLHADDGATDESGRRGGTFCESYRAEHWADRLYGAFRFD